MAPVGTVLGTAALGKHSVLAESRGLSKSFSSLLLRNTFSIGQLGCPVSSISEAKVLRVVIKECHQSDSLKFAVCRQEHVGRACSAVSPPGHPQDMVQILYTLLPTTFNTG